jgi:hypothetical protein
MDSYFIKKFWTGFTGSTGFLFDHSPDENGQTQSPSANRFNLIIKLGMVVVLLRR